MFGEKRGKAKKSLLLEKDCSFRKSILIFINITVIFDNSTEISKFLNKDFCYDLFIYSFSYCYERDDEYYIVIICVKHFIIRFTYDMSL